jgi:hypothetical protein
LEKWNVASNRSSKITSIVEIDSIKAQEIPDGRNKATWMNKSWEAGIVLIRLFTMNWA